VSGGGEAEAMIAESGGARTLPLKKRRCPTAPPLLTDAARLSRRQAA
jgi:hypothetical protein